MTSSWFSWLRRKSTPVAPPIPPPAREPHPALRHLQLTFTPAGYEELRRKYTHIGFHPPEKAADYWGRLPRYLIARCPLCGACRTEALDMHCLDVWTTNADFFNAVYGHYSQPSKGCAHFVAVQTFVNLNGTAPTEVDYLTIELDVPFVMPAFVPDDIPSVAVLHSLPICRIEAGAFVPRYAVYMITYFATDPQTLWKRRRGVHRVIVARDPEYWGPMLYTSGEASVEPEAWDLRHWVARGKLQWLDPTATDLPLTAGPPEKLPYADVPGYRRPVVIRDGKLTLTL